MNDSGVRDVEISHHVLRTHYFAHDRV